MLQMTVTAKTPLAEDILELVLSSTDGAPLPGFDGGAHVDLHLAPDLVRQYSLTNPSTTPSDYRVAVARDGASRGGSRFVHDALAVGATVTVSAPRNHFALAPHAKRHLFIAGGIGVTPILAMIRQCEAEGRPWSAVYATRTTARCAYRDVLAGYGARVAFHFDDQADGPLDVRAALAQADRDTHLYCCGPKPLMQAVREFTADWPAGQVHFEWFSAETTETAGDQAFDVVLNRSGRRLTVPADATLLSVLRDHGIPIASVCSEGVCGTCETTVLSGEVDHRDAVLTDEERDSNQMMMVCCSRGRGDIVLDL